MIKEQHGFRKSFSTCTSLLSLTNNIYENIEKGKYTVALFLDLSKDFDTVDHCILLHKMNVIYVVSCYLGIRDIGRIRRYLTEEATTHLIMAYVTSKLDCNNAILYKCAQGLISKLQIIHNNAARVIAKKKSHQSTEQVRKDLHWLPVKYHIQYKINLLTYKCLNDLAPSYLRRLLRYKTPARDNMRSTDKHLLEENKTITVAGDRAFANAAPVLWNQLPQHLRETETLGAFKKGLKTYLFNIAFQKKSS